MAILNRREVASWCLYDFANSTYSAVIAAVVFPVFYTTHIVGNEHGLGDLWWGRAVSLSMVTVALSSPLLGGLADFAGLRKRFLLAFTVLCISCVAAFRVLEPGMVLAGFVLMVLANIGLEGGVVFYNSFLPAIAPRRYQGRVSSWGFGVGYAGSMISLVLAIPLAGRGLFAEVWLMVAGMFALFSLPAFLFLPPDEKKASLTGSALRGFRHTGRTLKGVLRNREAAKFLAAYLLYADGVSTVIVFSSVFAATTLGFETGELIGLYLVVQATALVGAFVMARPMDYWGPKKVLTGSLLLWTAVCALAFFAAGKAFFMGVAAVAGLGLGTVQASSRAFYAQFIPEGNQSEYFGVYSMAGKSSAVLGPLLFGHLSVTMGSQRPAILAIALFFLVGFTLVQFIRGGGSNVGEGQAAP
ncbi:MAG: MFS transporter [Nitrospirota bacterium]|jgi:UMF1 family MFS transporter